jgi:hypothetical protein
MKSAAPRVTITRIWVLRFGMEPRLLATIILAFWLLHILRKSVRGSCSGGLQTAIGDLRVTLGALECAATKAGSKTTVKAARSHGTGPAATKSTAKSKAPS